MSKVIVYEWEKSRNQTSLCFSIAHEVDWTKLFELPMNSVHPEIKQIYFSATQTNEMK